MSETQQITITVSKEVATIIRKAVASGEYPDESTFVETKVREFLGDDLPDDILEREVLPVYDAMEANPSCGIPLEEARARMAERHRNYTRAAA